MPRQRLRLHFNFTVATVALVVCALDALTKAWARRELAGHAVHVWWVLWWRLTYNGGVSFSINESGPLLSVIVTSLIALVVVVVGLNASPGLPTAGFGLLLGGGVANVLDRLAATPHLVTDFVSVSSFAIFNLADAAITVGFVVLIVATLRGDRLLAR